MHDWIVYLDHARELVDALPDDGDGAIGGNWQPGYTRDSAEGLLREYLLRGYARGHDHAPRF